MKVNRNDLLRAGEELRRVLSTEGYSVALEILRADYTTKITTSAYGQREEREENYKKLVALEDLHSVMSTLASQAELNMLKQEEEDTDATY